GWLTAVQDRTWGDLREAQQRRGVGGGGSEVVERLQTVEAREDLVKCLEEEFDQELLEEATARVQLRVAPHTWEAFRLVAVERRSGAEAATKLGMKVAAVFVAKSRVQKMLREEVRRLEGAGPEDRQ